MNGKDPILIKAKYVFSWSKLEHFLSEDDRGDDIEGAITTVPLGSRQSSVHSYSSVLGCQGQEPHSWQHLLM